MTRAALAFTTASFLPVPLIAAGALSGGVWGWLALAYMTVLVYGLDQLIAVTDGDGREFPAHDVLSVALAIAHFGLLGLAVAALAAPGAATPDRVALFLATGLFLGQVSNSNAHELIHRGRRPLFRLGRWVYISLLFGHHASAHPLVHHRHVGTDSDPNSARLGESYYRFVPRAWSGSFRAGYLAERDRLAQRGRGPWAHPYLVYLGGGAGFIALAASTLGLRGVIAYVALAGFAQSQLLLSDYVQHYGLRRRRLADGRPEPVGPRHSWNAPHWYSSHLMLNAPRHSDHHAHPARPYPALTLPAPDEAPTLPRSLPAMACVALVPGLWRRVMDPRVRPWAA